MRQPINLPGQIMVSTLLVLLIVSLAVLAITATVARSGRQIFNNLEYERSYNDSENALLEYSDLLADPGFNLNNLITNGLGTGTCQQVGNKYICTFVGADGRITVLTIYETNEVDNYELGPDEYFDVILADNLGQIYREGIGISWVGQTALSFTVVYQHNNQMYSGNDVYERSTGLPVYTALPATTAGVFRGNFGQASASNLTVDLRSNNLNPDALVSGVNTSTISYKTLRIRSVSRTAGTSITIRPAAANGGVLPNQVRRIEAITYLSDLSSSSAPVVSIQLPLSPQVPAPLSFGANINALNTGICGNGIVEGREECDIGSGKEDAFCRLDCTRRCVALNEFDPAQPEKFDINPDPKVIQNDRFSLTLLPHLKFEGDGNNLAPTLKYNGRNPLALENRLVVIKQGENYYDPVAGLETQVYIDRPPDNSSPSTVHQCLGPFGGIADVGIGQPACAQGTNGTNCISHQDLPTCSSNNGVQPCRGTFSVPSENTYTPVAMPACNADFSNRPCIDNSAALRSSRSHDFLFEFAEPVSNFQVQALDWGDLNYRPIRIRGMRVILDALDANYQPLRDSGGNLVQFIREYRYDPDPDTTVDSNGNGIVNDDFGNGIWIDRTIVNGAETVPVDDDSVRYRGGACKDPFAGNGPGNGLYKVFYPCSSSNPWSDPACKRISKVRVHFELRALDYIGGNQRNSYERRPTVWLPGATDSNIAISNFCF